jgi:glutamate-5-semialdehyde dehydrogenase
MTSSNIQIHDEMLSLASRAMVSARKMLKIDSEQKNNALLAMAEALEKHTPRVLEANKKDMENAQNAGLSSAMLDRLMLNESRIMSMVNALRAIVNIPDPVGRTIRRWKRPNGLIISKVRVPIGVILIIYESRPNVTADSAALCIKASNAVILRGGKEALCTNSAIADALIEGCVKAGLPENVIQFVKIPDHSAVQELLRMEGLIDLVIPRGGENLIRTVTQMSRIPVIKHYKGVCHLYVDASADQEMALKITENAKCQRPGVCNAIEKLLVHRKIAKEFLPRVSALLKARNVELRGDAESRTIVPDMREATEEDWYAEYLDLILTVKVVSSVHEAVEHINKYGSHHSDAIIAKSKTAQKIFTEGVDSAAVYVNASTRFTDGGEFGMGAEIGISTDKLHARGPMGVEELTTYKYIVRGNGQIRQ